MILRLYAKPLPGMTDIDAEESPCPPERALFYDKQSPLHEIRKERWMMKLSHILVVAVLAIAAVYFVAQRGGATEIGQSGNDLSIAIGNHKLEATKAGPEFTDSFLVIGGMEGSDFYFSAYLSVIPLETAERLAERYGNFRRCGSPGARAGMQSVESMVLYAANAGVERKLKKFNKLGLSGKDPVIEMTFYLLEMKGHTIEQGGHEMQVPSHDIGPSFLVTNARLIQQGLTF